MFSGFNLDKPTSVGFLRHILCLLLQISDRINKNGFFFPIKVSNYSFICMAYISKGIYNFFAGQHISKKTYIYVVVNVSAALNVNFRCNRTSRLPRPLLKKNCVSPMFSSYFPYSREWMIFRYWTNGTECFTAFGISFFVI